MVCKPEQQADAGVKLKVNDKEIELNNFAKNFISQTITGMVKSLRGVTDVETVSLKISNKVK